MAGWSNMTANDPKTLSPDELAMAEQLIFGATTPKMGPPRLPPLPGSGPGGMSMTAEQALAAKNGINAANAPAPQGAGFEAPPPMGPQGQEAMPPPPPGDGSPSSPIGSPQMIDRSDYNELVARLNSKGVNSLNQQQQGLADAERQIQLALQHSNPQLDLSPIIGLVDSWTGSKLQNSYQRPDYKGDQDTIRQLEAGLQKGRAGLAANEVDLLKAQLGIEADRMNAEERNLDRDLQRKSMQQQRELANADRREKQDMQNKEHFEAKFGGKLRDSERFQSQLNEFRDLVTRNKGIPLTGPERQRAESLYSDLTVAYKNPAGLGALAGPDKEIIRGVLGPDSLTGFLSSEIYKGGAQGLTQALDDVARRNTNVHDSLFDSAKGTYRDSSATSLLQQHEEAYKKTFAPKQPAAGSPSQRPMTREEKIKFLQGGG